ncbi:MAG: PilN domain-containing protein [Gammaproteobacteria bacterium]|nr:PilN domain-containing protein [Gammaproteobacteria bacterium]
MAGINLLPWREKLRKEREQQFYVLLGFFCGLALVVGVVFHIVISSLTGLQESRNSVLTQAIAQLDGEISNIKSLEVEKTRLLNRMTVIQKLQYSRPEVVHLFEELITTLPDGVQLLKVTQNNNTLSIEGIAESNSRISSLLRNMDRSDWLTEPQLIVINSDTREHPNSSWFSMQVKRTRPGVANNL